tara:strand:- start:3194 stop:4993 length:1800 start_codon:yes stop_codon:yes gene_type:complete
MGKSVGFLTIMFGANLKGFDRAMKKAQRSIGKFGASMQRTGQTLTRNVTVPLAGLGVAAIKMASDFEETNSKFKTVFSSIQHEAEQTARTFKQSFGLSSKSAKQLLSDTGDLLVGFGFTEKEALDLSKQVNELAVDLASFTNFSGGAEGASLALTKALLGERESIKSLGIAITEADLKEFAKDQGLVFKELDRVAKATLTYQLALKQSSKAVGDFSRTSGSFANQTRILLGEINDLAIELGTHLLPLAQKLLAWGRNVVKNFTNLNAAQKQNALEWGAIAFALGPVLNLFGTFIRLVSLNLIPFLFSTAGLVMALSSAFVLLYNNLNQIINRIINLVANDFDASFFTAFGAAMKAIKMPGGDALIKFGAQMAGIVATGKDLPELEFKSFSDIIKELATNFKELSGASKLFTGGLNFDTGKIPFLSAMNPKAFIGPLNQIGGKIKELTQKQKEFNAAMTMFENIMSSAMTSAAYSTDGFFKGFIENIKQSIKQLLVQLAVSLVIKSLFGFDVTKYKTAFQAAKAGVLGLANGGLVTGPTMALVGEGAGTSASNPEVVAPLDKLKGMINGGSQQVEVFGRISGNDIFISNQRGGLTRQRAV